MNNNKLNQLDFEIDLRLSDSGWNEMIADKIVNRVRERKNRLIRRNLILGATIAILFSAGLLQTEQEESITPVVESYVSPGYENVIESTFKNDGNILLTGFTR